MRVKSSQKKQEEEEETGVERLVWKHVCLLVLVSVCLYVSMWAVDLCA